MSLEEMAVLVVSAAEDILHVCDKVAVAKREERREKAIAAENMAREMKKRMNITC